MRKTKILPTVVLSSICAVVALLLALSNMITAPEIEKAQKKKEAKALQEVYPAGESFDALVVDGLGLPTSITAAYAADNGGYVFKSEVKGYKSGLIIMVGVDAEGRITDTKCVESNETNGAENKLNGAYNGKSAEEELLPVLIGGSTKTSMGYKNAVADSLAAYGILKGDRAK